jgi:muconolactone D-isomerase
MLFHVVMEVKLPPDMPAELSDELKAREREYSQKQQRAGRWPHLWRVAGRYANVSVLDVDSTDELHDVLSGLPLFPYLDIRVTPLARHPNAIDQEGEIHVRSRQ